MSDVWTDAAANSESSVDDEQQFLSLNSDDDSLLPTGSSISLLISGEILFSPFQTGRKRALLHTTTLIMSSILHTPIH